MSLAAAQTPMGISLGWNCNSAMHGVAHGLRPRKEQGYRTCPFDKCISNPEGIAACFSEDFAHFCDPQHLALVEAPFSTGGIRRGERLLCNTHYGFVFNHESPDHRQPGHAPIWQNEAWQGGALHFVADGFAEFRRRYEARIANLRAYMADPTIRVRFLLTVPALGAGAAPEEEALHAAIAAAYPAATFEVQRLGAPEGEEAFVREHFALMGSARSS